MNDFALRITLELGTRHREFEAAELAAILEFDDLEPVLLGLLFQGPHPHVVNKRREGREGGASRKENNENVSFVREEEGRERGCRGEGREEEDRDFASFLAERLDDAKSLAFYRRVARIVPSPIIRDCLTRALDLPARDVRRSRAAYFTTLCLPHLREHEAEANRSRHT